MVVEEEDWEVQEEAVLLWVKMGRHRQPPLEHINHAAAIKPNEINATQQQALQNIMERDDSQWVK